MPEFKTLLGLNVDFFESFKVQKWLKNSQQDQRIKFQTKNVNQEQYAQ